MRSQVWGISMVKDEGDIVFDVVAHMAEEGVDGILIADNDSSDETLDRLHDAKAVVECPLVIVSDLEIGYYQSVKMTRLAQQVMEFGADWIVPFDADEIWCSYGGPFAGFLRSLPFTAQALQVRLWNHVKTDLDPPGNPFESMVYRLQPVNFLPKVAVRAANGVVIETGNHGATLQGAPVPPIFFADFPMEIHHFQYRSFEQFRSKILNGGRAYEATDLPAGTGAHWREHFSLWQQGGDEALRRIYEERFHYPDPVESGLVLDPAPFRRWGK